MASSGYIKSSKVKALVKYCGNCNYCRENGYLYEPCASCYDSRNEAGEKDKPNFKKRNPKRKKVSE